MVEISGRVLKKKIIEEIGNLENSIWRADLAIDLEMGISEPELKFEKKKSLFEVYSLSCKVEGLLWLYGKYFVEYDKKLEKFRQRFDNINNNLLKLLYE